MTKTEVLKRVKGLNDKQKNSVVCSLVGHSNIQSYCLGYYSCGRCGEQIGDNMCGNYSNAKNVVVIDHNCKTCRKNYKKLTWKDKLFVKNPFKKVKI